jgi:hypothetical protein
MSRRESGAGRSSARQGRDAIRPRRSADDEDLDSLLERGSSALAFLESLNEHQPEGKESFQNKNTKESNENNLGSSQFAKPPKPVGHGVDHNTERLRRNSNSKEKSNSKENHGSGAKDKYRDINRDNITRLISLEGVAKDHEDDYPAKPVSRTSSIKRLESSIKHQDLPSYRSNDLNQSRSISPDQQPKTYYYDEAEWTSSRLRNMGRLVVFDPREEEIRERYNLPARRGPSPRTSLSSRRRRSQVAKELDASRGRNESNDNNAVDLNRDKTVREREERDRLRLEEEQEYYLKLQKAKIERELQRQRNNSKREEDSKEKIRRSSKESQEIKRLIELPKVQDSPVLEFRKFKNKDFEPEENSITKSLQIKNQGPSENQEPDPFKRSVKFSKNLESTCDLRLVPITSSKKTPQDSPNKLSFDPLNFPQTTIVEEDSQIKSDRSLDAQFWKVDSHQDIQYRNLASVANNPNGQQQTGRWNSMHSEEVAEPERCPPNTTRDYAPSPQVAAQLANISHMFGRQTRPSVVPTSTISLSTFYSQTEEEGSRLSNLTRNGNNGKVELPKLPRLGKNDFERIGDRVLGSNNDFDNMEVVGVRRSRDGSRGSNEERRLVEFKENIKSQRNREVIGYTDRSRKVSTDHSNSDHYKSTLKFKLPISLLEQKKLPLEYSAAEQAISARKVNKSIKPLPADQAVSALSSRITSTKASSTRNEPKRKESDDLTSTTQKSSRNVPQHQKDTDYKVLKCSDAPNLKKFYNALTTAEDENQKPTQKKNSQRTIPKLSPRPSQSPRPSKPTPFVALLTNSHRQQYPLIKSSPRPFR